MSEGEQMCDVCVCVYIYIYIVFKTFFYVVRHLDSIASYLPTGLHLGFFSFMTFLIPSIQFFFGLPRALFCFGIHFSAILGNLPDSRSRCQWYMASKQDRHPYAVLQWYDFSSFCSVSIFSCSSLPAILSL